jgi:hypothetical protein
MFLAQTFCRKFCWHSLMLWPEDMPEATSIVMSGNDSLVPTDLAAAQLKASSSKASVILHPTAMHGGFLLDPKFQLRLIEEVKALANAASSIKPKR